MRFQFEQGASDGAFAAGRDVVATVSWLDRRGAAQSVALRSFIARADPAVSGALALAAGTVPAAPRGYRGRQPTVFIGARDLGSGRSVWQPPGGVTFALDNASGDVSARCDGLDAATAIAADLSRCTAMHRLIVSGTLRTGFVGDAPLPLPPLTLQLVLTGSASSTALCFSQALKTVRYASGGSLRIESVRLDTAAASAGLASWQDTGDRYLGWQCMVPTRPDGSWSGRLEVADAEPATARSVPRQLCRIAAGTATTAAGNGANIAPSAEFMHVTTPLAAQNFLVIEAGRPCPSSAPVIGTS